MSPADLAERIRGLGPGRGAGRTLTAIVGAPASGKSTLAEAVTAALGPEGALVPMDSFHLDDGILGPRGLLPRKGAPETFDAGGLARTLTAVREGGEVFVPVFDRSREIAVAAAAVVPTEARHVVVEGNWLLLDRDPWRELGPWDLTVMLREPEGVLRERLMARWAHLPAEEARRKTEANDLPNARLVAEASRPADVMLTPAGV